MIPIPSVITAFTAGLLSILTPCVLPIIPSFIAYIAGVSVGGRRLQTFLHSLAFSAGFIGIFLAVGSAIGSFSQIFLLHQRLFQIIGGVVIILFGLFMIGGLGNSMFFRERRFAIPAGIAWLARFGYLRSFVIGILFSVGWSPCYGPILGAIITLALTSASKSIGIMLLGVYGLGFVMPFLVGSIFIDAFTGFARKLSPKLEYVKFGAAILLLALGVSLATGWYNTLVGSIVIKYETAGILLP
ncbi:MAG: cytochrome c biogenesis protein CcdA [Patescibacteria group bacterium]